eukprot:3634123-Heterocapsa_arctica.AAC.1
MGTGSSPRSWAEGLGLFLGSPFFFPGFPGSALVGSCAVPFPITMRRPSWKMGVSAEPEAFSSLFLSSFTTSCSPA